MDAARLGRRGLDIREESIMDDGAYFLYSPADELGEAFVVTQLVEEVIAADENDLSS